MNWYSKSIPEAIAEAKNDNKLFVVYIEDNDDLSKKMTTTYDDPAVSKRLSEKCVAIKLKAYSRSYLQFSEIYPVLVIPSSFFIGKNGIPIEIVAGNLEPDDFVKKLDEVFELHKEESGAKPSEISNMEPEKTKPENGCETDTFQSNAAASSSSVNETSAASTSASKDASSINKETVSRCEPSKLSSETSPPEIPSTSQSISPTPPQSVNDDQNSTEDNKPSLDERVERAKLLLEEQRARKAAEEREKEKLEEKERRRVGKEIQKAHQSRQDNELKEWAQTRAKEKEEEREARERIRAQIAQDRAERAAKFQQEKSEQTALRKEKEDARLRAEQEIAAMEAAQRSTVARLQFRLPDGSSVTHQFPADSPLEEARRYVKDEIRPSFTSFTLCTTFPRRHFTESNYAETLRDLQLAPSAALLVLPGQAVVQVRKEGGFVNNVLWTVVTPFLVLWRFISSFFGRNTPVNSQAGNSSTQPSSTSQQSNSARKEAPNAEGTATQRKDQAFYRREGNVFRLSNQPNDDDENNTWNGNSTQQM